MPSYLYYIQDPEGREVVSAHVDVEKVGDVTGRITSLVDDDHEVELVFEDLVIDSKPFSGDRPTDLTLYRVPSDDKLAKPVSHPLP